MSLRRLVLFAFLLLGAAQASASAQRSTVVEIAGDIERDIEGILRGY